jgi:hypothetical protein
MAGNPRENSGGKGFWDGGAKGQSSNGQTAGRPSGFPGRRLGQRLGVKTDIEFPAPPDKSGETKP